MDGISVSIPAWIIKRKIVVFYLIVDDRIDKILGEAINRPPGDEFYDSLAKHINAYLKDGVMPPAEIAPAIMNLIDDQRSGRDMVLRAGDYISLQNYLRKK